MNYEFAHISHLEEVAKAIEGRREFVLVDKGSYSVVNYVIASPSTFPPVSDKDSAILRECRGLIFDSEGAVLSRPFHKFFNVGEKEETSPDLIDMDKEHVVLEKLDGSMIRPLFLDTTVRWGTKMGLTDVSSLAEEFVETRPQYNALALHCRTKALTPIFEFCSQRNRVVVDYPRPRLVLTAVRHNNSGVYLKYDEMRTLAADFDVEVVRAVSSRSSNIVAFLEEVKAEASGEGYVIRFQETGHMVKVKTEWYLSLHRSKAAIETEKGVIRLILEERADDVRSTLSSADRARFESFEKLFLNGLHTTQDELLRSYDKYRDMTVKEFASGPAQSMEKGLRNLLFVLLRETSVTPRGVWDLLVDHVLHRSTCKKKIEEMRYLWGGAPWEETSFEEDG